MANQLGPIEINCDAPPYFIVQACQAIGIHSPEDVGWYRMSHYLNAPVDQLEPLQSQWWPFLPGISRSTRKPCVCGQQLPELVRCTFTLRSQQSRSYLLGQCNRCRTVFWEEA